MYPIPWDAPKRQSFPPLFHVHHHHLSDAVRHHWITILAVFADDPCQLLRRMVAGCWLNQIPKWKSFPIPSRNLQMTIQDSKSWISSMFLSLRKVTWARDSPIQMSLNLTHELPMIFPYPWPFLVISPTNDPQSCTAAAIATPGCQLADSSEGPTPSPGDVHHSRYGSLQLVTSPVMLWPLWLWYDGWNLYKNDDLPSG